MFLHAGQISFLSAENKKSISLSHNRPGNYTLFCFGMNFSTSINEVDLFKERRQRNKGTRQSFRKTLYIIKVQAVKAKFLDFLRIFSVSTHRV